MHIHFIAVGGSAMHNLAIALHKKGYRVSGSDDEIFEPSRSRLAKYGLLPLQNGWDKKRITPDVDAVILGMHARSDNPELLEAQHRGVKIFSYPEFLFEQTKDKKRIVIGGSHGKTTITSMIMHVLKSSNILFDYMVGAQLDGFETMVGLENDSQIAVFEGDEYLSSPTDRRPKFHLYHPHIAVISGIAWDHINVFPTFDNYVEQFAIFARMIEPGGKLFYYKNDDELQKIAGNITQAATFEYDTQPHVISGGRTFLCNGENPTPLKIFGEHNLQNISAAKMVCTELGISDMQFFNSMRNFSGAAHRLEILAENEWTAVFRDFAHSPSKLQATAKAVKKQFPQRKLVACMELHTFSSLKKDFLPLYKNSMEDTDAAFVYFNPHTVEHKKLEPVSSQLIYESFGKPGLVVTTDSETLFEKLKRMEWQNANLLMMSSGNFDGRDLPALAAEIVVQDLFENRVSG
ncbi:MAG: Mur ligase family protein [Prolixibacteraceae bacterium]|nr:Mur ligase family protein [Prolixibacteraceae bacterium]